MPSGESPADIAAASPPLEPPDVLSRFQGLSVLPNRSFTVSAASANSGQFVFPMTIAPASFSLRTAVASESGTRSAYSSEPLVLRIPSVSKTSFTVKGTPCRGPSDSPFITSRSASRAWSRADSFGITMALMAEFTESLRSRCAWTISTGDTSFDRIRCANSVASE